MTIWSKLSLIIVGTFEETCCSVVLPLCGPKMTGARLQDLRSGCLRVNQLIERYWLSLSSLKSAGLSLARWLTGYPLHSDVPRSNERQVGSLAAGCPELDYGFREVALLKWSFLGNLGFLVALRKQWSLESVEGSGLLKDIAGEPEAEEEEDAWWWWMLASGYDLK